ncbi:unnamed protein product [Citrullus colocynthis]|uniref:Uncharacterized protein n=1 Tax=Citrullus colocynthis TaxID=252529 RepID=A0ABP0YH43_9ROSI
MPNKVKSLVNFELLTRIQRLKFEGPRREVSRLEVKKLGKELACRWVLNTTRLPLAHQPHTLHIARPSCVQAASI